MVPRDADISPVGLALRAYPSAPRDENDDKRCERAGAWKLAQGLRKTKVHVGLARVTTVSQLQQYFAQTPEANEVAKGWQKGLTSGTDTTLTATRPPSPTAAKTDVAQSKNKDGN